MNGRYVDLHVHSYWSDGSMSPEDIAAAAAENGVGLLAVADHDIMEGSAACSALCHARGILCIPAVEIDTVENGVNFHILAYGFDMDDCDFTAFLRCTRFLLDESSMKLVEAMAGDYDVITLSDYFDYTRDIHQGGWNALQYLRDKGITTALKEGIRFYGEYGMSYEKSGFSTIRAACMRIHRAGGYAVLAHPGELIDTSDVAAFKAALRRLAGLGLDGIECYYPSNTELITQACIDVCNERCLLITAGSDCHGTFGRTRVGEMNITRDKVRLGKLCAAL